MKEHPILFSGPMVRALLAGTKTQTRRVIMFKTCGPAEPAPTAPDVDAAWIARCCQSPYGGPGDRLWVRETWAGDDGCGFVYRADHPDADIARGDLDDGEQTIRRWHPSIFMRRNASRVTLGIASVGVERLHDITEDDIRAEGVTRESVGDLLATARPKKFYPIARDWQELWALG